jgi:hypothetical protein
MIKERLKELDIKITELANYLQISRPTMYKFIDSYDSGKKSEVSNSVLKLFDYIEESELIAKKNVINYILNTMVTISENDESEVNEIMSIIREYISSNSNSEKTQFITKIITTTQFDTVIHYLIEISPLLKKRKLTDSEKEKMLMYNSIIKMYSGIKEG